MKTMTKASLIPILVELLVVLSFPTISEADGGGSNIKHKPLPTVGWAIGQGETINTAVIVHTVDGGVTWQKQGDSSAWTGQGNDISAVDKWIAWAALGSAGDGETGGAILHTRDGGATWTMQAIPAGLSGGIKAVKGLSRREAWAASLGGTILHTTDGGHNWNIVPHPTAPIVQVNRMDAMGRNVWIADAATGGAVVHSHDGGHTWRGRRWDQVRPVRPAWRAEYLPNSDSPLTVHAFSPLAVWASGASLPNDNPSFYRTVDAGVQWEHVIQVGANDHLDDICAASPNDVWGALNGDGIDGRVWRVHVERDGLVDAKDVTPPAQDGYVASGVTCLDTRVAWVVGSQQAEVDKNKPLGIILHTTDGGETWAQQSAPDDVFYWKISFAGARR